MDKSNTTLLNTIAAGPAEHKVKKSDDPARSDLSALLRRAAFGESSYQEFPAQLRLCQDPQPSGKAPLENERFGSSAPPQTREPAKTHRKEDFSDDVASNPATPEQSSPSLREEVRLTPWHTNRGSSWPALDKVFAERTEDFDLIRSITEAIKIPVVFIGSMIGGTGGTTIIATLGRCLADFGENVAIAETELSLVLPYYFTTQESDDSTILRFKVPGSDKTVHIVQGSRTPATLMFPAVQNDGREVGLLSRLREAAEVSSRFVLDASRLCLEDLLGATQPLQRTLIPIVPDFGSALGVLALEARLRTKIANSQRSNLPFYVLNKFDPKLALHRDTEALLKGALGKRLLPVILRRSDSVSEALAKGMTVVDYCPGTGIAQDFQQLTAWVRRATSTIEPETGQQ